MKKEQLFCKNCGHTLLPVEVTRYFRSIKNHDELEVLQKERVLHHHKWELVCNECRAIYRCRVDKKSNELQMGERIFKGVPIDWLFEKRK